MIEAKPLPSAAPHGQPSTSNQLPPVAVDALPLASARPIKRLRQVKPLPSRAASLAPRPPSPAPGPSLPAPRPPPPPPPPSPPPPLPPPAKRPSDEDGLDELALALYRVVTGTSTPSPKPAAAAVLPDISTASVISASVAMSPAATTATLVTSDEESVKTADHLPSASTVAAQLRSMLQRAETTGEEVASDPARLFDCLASDTFMNGPEDDAAVDGCSHPHSMICCDVMIDSSEPPKLALAQRHRHPHRGVVHVHKPAPPAKQGQRSSGVWRWPFHKKHRLPQDRDGDTSEEPLGVWYPSTTQMSLHATWWGYSIYLPPPVMEELDGDRVDTFKRVAAISTALNFILTKLPSLFALSPPLLVAIGLMQGLAPIVGYVASFIAWSWAHVKSFDRGQGVVLSATWAMPVALIPRAWDAPRPPDADDLSSITAALDALHLTQAFHTAKAPADQSPVLYS